MLLFLWYAGKGKHVGAKDRSVVARQEGWQGVDSNGCMKEFWGGGTVLYLDCGSSYTAVHLSKLLKLCKSILPNAHLKIIFKNKKPECLLTLVILCITSVNR